MGVVDWLKRMLSGISQTVPPFPAGTGPARLLILRHAEKTGDKRDRGLSEAGRARAEKLAAYIPKTFGAPDFLIAASSGKKSDRPYDTLVPLAKALGLEIWADLDDEEVDDMVEALAETPEWRGKFGVISWRHSDLSRLIAALGAPDGTYPDPWDPSRFDLLIDMTFSSAGPPKVRQINPPF